MEWTEPAQQAFDTVKEAINNCPTLFFMDWNAPVFLATDASDYGIGAYLYQVVDGKQKPIRFMSKSLNTTELKWSTIDKEMYAIVYALFKFDHLLRDIKFTLQTDHKNLTYLVDSRSPRVQRWRSEIQQYNMVVTHIPGEDNVVADAFSRQLDLTPEQINVLSVDIIMGLYELELDLS